MCHDPLRFSLCSGDLYFTFSHHPLRIRPSISQSDPLSSATRLASTRAAGRLLASAPPACSRRAMSGDGAVRRTGDNCLEGGAWGPVLPSSQLTFGLRPLGAGGARGEARRGARSQRLNFRTVVVQSNFLSDCPRIQAVREGKHASRFR